MAMTMHDVARLTTLSRKGELRILNLTGHVVTITVGSQTVTFQPDHTAARVHYVSRQLPPISWVDDSGRPFAIPRRRVRRGMTQNLPEPNENVILLVSRIVAAYSNGRSDLLVPDGVMRDSRGAAFACTYLTEVDEENG